MIDRIPWAWVEVGRALALGVAAGAVVGMVVAMLIPEGERRGC